MDGYTRWELAKRTGRQTLNCFEHDFSLEEALGQLIQTHRGLQGLPDFVRIELALDLEPHFQEKARLNQQAGGERKGLSTLTKAQQVDTRREVASVAGVCSGNVRKVKNILSRACPQLIQAARLKEVSINLADQWCLEPPKQQQENLRRTRMERGMLRKARNLSAALVERPSTSGRDRQTMRAADLIRLLIDCGSIEVQIVDEPGMTIFITEELSQSLTARKERIV